MSKRILTKSIVGLTDGEFTYSINIQPNTILFKVEVEKELVSEMIDIDPETKEITNVSNVTKSKYIIEQYQLSLTALKQSPYFKTNTLISPVHPTVGFDGNIKPNNFINLSSMTHAQRAVDPYSMKMPTLTAKPGLAIFIKDLNGTFEDYDIIIYADSSLNTDTHFTSNEPFEEYEVANKYSHLNLLDEIVITHDAPSDSADYYSFNVSSASYVDEVYLEQVFGILDRSRVELNNGVGKFRVLKSSIDTGIPVRVRAGYKYYTGLTEFNQVI